MKDFFKSKKIFWLAFIIPFFLIFTLISDWIEDPRCAGFPTPDLYECTTGDYFNDLGRSLHYLLIFISFFYSILLLQGVRNIFNGNKLRGFIITGICLIALFLFIFS
jgi:hypothetical protein